MMKAKKFLSLLLCGAMASCVGFAACEGDVHFEVDEGTKPAKLTAPVISLSDNVISWSAVEHADGYDVYEGTTKVVSQTSTTYTITQTAVGSYEYTVYATSTDTEKYTTSAASNKVTYEVKAKEEVVHEKLAADKKIYVVGDSTVCDYRPKLDDYYLPRYGYGTMLYNFIDLTSEDQVVNLAISGRSSLSFLTEDNYKTLTDNIGEGDYLIIGFGHNDEKSDDAARFTDPNPDYKTATNASGKPSFQYTLYENYVKLAKDKGATPILCTPIVRYNASGEYDGKSVAHVTADGDYPAAIKKLGTDTNTAVVDLTAITKEYYKAHGDDAKYFHAYTTYNESGSDKIPDGIDTTHINMYGAKMISYWFATNLPSGCPLLANVKETLVEPTYAADFAAAVKSDYTKPNYSGFNPADHAANKVGTIGDGEWYHTAMGILGGASKVADYKFTNDGGKYTITTGNGSKFAASQDGFGALFTQIDISKNFTISVKAKVIDVPSSKNDQNAFGIMLRDDIYIDTHDTTIASNFVTASVNGNGKTNMSRVEKTALTFDSKKLSLVKDAEYELTLERKGQVVTVTVKQGDTTVETVFTDLSYVGVDNNYVYLCLFANRDIDVEFSNIEYKITGTSQGA